MLLEVHRGRDFQSQRPLSRATYDINGVAWVATASQLFRFDAGRWTLADSDATGDRRLALAPGGGRYVWMTNRIGTFGKFSVELLNLAQPARPFTSLQTYSEPFTFSALHVGSLGRLIVASSPLQDVEGLHGDFYYQFWSDGLFQRSLSLAGRRIGVVEDSGESILLMGAAGITALRKDGTDLWSVPTYYRNGVIAASGTVAVVNPADAVEEVHVIRSGTVTKVRMTHPVHELAITPDGSQAAVATGDGKLSFIDLKNCVTLNCPSLRSLSLPILNIHFITAIRFLDRDTVALGVIQGMGSRSRPQFSGASVLVVTRTGNVQFRMSIPLPQPATWSPSLDAMFGSRVFAAFTPVAAVFIKVGN